MRHDIFPVLKKRFPAVFENFFRSTRLIASQQQLLDQHITKEFDAVKMDVVEKIHLQKLRTLENEKQKLVLRAWFRENNLRMPSEKQLQQIQRDVLLAGPDANPVFCLEKKILKRSHDYLYLVSPHD
ncbi:MAG: hypothetical protein A2624_01660 [Gammaproteobacteria bacterium RIFCSPHIGHO2_01_FULL_42_8]|nr:MAG: hypothetical protein A2624_01660 [Gammaproteobacteria bacterium RIFCSPHIGHO2_01_FULL_42_8]